MKQTVRTLIFFGLLCGVGAAQTFAVSPPAVTATQAELAYTSPSAGSCTLQVSESPGLTPVVHDVDETLFPGSSLDSRTGNLSNNLQRTFVVGTRRVDLASDGNLYSRALQANTVHYFQITCGSATATGSFQTGNPPLGNNYAEPLPFNSAGFGNYGWPTINWNDTSVLYIDPQTGFAVKRITDPTWYGRVSGYGSDGNGQFVQVIDINGAWTNAGNAASGTQTTLATYSGANSDPLFLTYDNQQFQGLGGYQFSGYGGSFTLSNVQIALFGTGTASAPADRTVSVCLSFYDSGQTCNTAWFPMVLPAAAPSSSTTASALYPSATQFPNGGFWAGWNVTPQRSDMGVVAGTVSVNGNTATASAELNLKWKAGAKIYIAGTAPTCPNNVCTISSVPNANTLVLVQTLPSPVTGAQFYSMASGFVVMKNTSNGSVSISASSGYSSSPSFGNPISGDIEFCSRTQATVSYAADGVTPITPVPGELCLANSANLFLLIPSTGETRFLSPMYMDNSALNPVSQDYACSNGCSTTLSTFMGSFDLTNPNLFYGAIKYASSGWSIVNITYNTQKSGCNYASYAHPAYVSGSYVNGEDQTGSWYQGHQWADSCLTWDNHNMLPSQGRDSDTQVAAQPNWKPIFKSIYGSGNATPDAIRWGKAWFKTTKVSQNEPGLLYLFDAQSGNLQWASDTFSTFPARWGGNHTTSIAPLTNHFSFVSEDIIGFGGSPNPNYLGFGPFQFTPTAMWKSGAWSSDTSITADSTYAIACPTGLATYLVQEGAVGNNCYRFQTHMACSHGPYAGEAATFPCPDNAAWSMLTPMAVGDEFQNLTSFLAGGLPPEHFQIVQITPLGNNNYDIITSRNPLSGFTGGCAGYPPGIGGWLNGWTAGMVPKCYGTFVIDITDLAAGFAYYNLGPGHSSLGFSPSVNSPTSVQPGYGVTYQQPLMNPTLPFTGNPGYFTATANEPFAGQAPQYTQQSYPSQTQWSSTDPADYTWVADFHALNPSGGSSAENFQTISSNFNPGTLAPGTQTVWKFTYQSGALNYKLSPVTAYAGHYLLQEVSSPATGNVITDSTPWQFCVAYVSGECRTGSNAGDVYMSVPQAGGSFSGNLGVCSTNFLDENMPCAVAMQKGGASIIQQEVDVADSVGINWRKVSTGFMGPGREFNYATAIVEPTGKWAIFSCQWCGGVRTDLFMAKLPPFPRSTKATGGGSTFQPVSVTLGASASMDLARVRFGYAENGGNPATFYCTPRQEDCSTTANAGASSPFAFESESPVWTSCSGGCSITVPALSGRIVYYVIDRKNSTTGTVETSGMMTAVNP
jgi:hypothetical protein